MTSDPKQDRTFLERVEGYPRLAHLFARFPQVASYRRFGDMAHLVLLYKQACLVKLEESLTEQIIADSEAADGVRKHFATDWTFMHQVRAHKEIKSTPERQKQSKLLDESFGALKEYYEFFGLTMQMTANTEPRKSDREYLQWWLQDPGHGCGALSGDDWNIWASLAKPYSGAKDLMCVRPRPDDDLFTEWVKSKLIRWFDKHVRRRLSKHPDSREDFTYGEATIRKYVHVFAVTLISLLLIGSMGILSWVQSMKTRMALIALFCAMFIICMSCVTKARRSEVFSALSGFAAVQLAFITNNGSCNGGTNVAGL